MSDNKQEVTIDLLVSKLNNSVMEPSNIDNIDQKDKKDKKDNKDNKEKIYIPRVQLFYLEYKNNFKHQILNINGIFWNYIENLTIKLDKKSFFEYFNITIMMYQSFKKGKFKDASDYFRRCQLLSILQLMSFINNSLPQFNKRSSLIKIGTCKNGIKNCCIIDDSTVIDNEDNLIRESNGTEKEPHRGFKMFNQLSSDMKMDVIISFHNSFIQLENLLRRIKNRQYLLFNPIELIQRIVKYCENNKMFNIINLLSWEIHDTPYKLSDVEQVKLFEDYDHLSKLWKDKLISDNQGKFRIFILSMYFMDNIFRNNIKEILDSVES